MRTTTYGLLLGLTISLAACTKTPPPHYRFSPAQLAWQPYQKGQVLRFGNSRSGATRAYVIESAYDDEYQPNNGPNLTLFSGGKESYYQQQRAYIQRTDTADLRAFSAVEMRFDYWYDYPSQVGSEIKPSVIARVGWLYFPEISLPVDDLNKGNAPDTTVFMWLKAYPALQFGATTYTSVVRIKPPASQVGSTVAIYYAKANGVVAFEDKRTGLWYRLP